MPYSYLSTLALFLSVSLSVQAQSLAVSQSFSLQSPFNEPDGRNDVVQLSPTDFITLAKVKGSESSKSDFLLERYGQDLKPLWQTPLSAENYEDYLDIYFNGKEAVLLSVQHNTAEKKSKLEAYGFNISNGQKNWSKELDAYPIADWKANSQKGRVKESFTDLVCEHTNPDFVTPFEYKHNVKFSPDGSKFISYVFDYGQNNLIANVSTYDNACNLISQGKVGIDNGFVNQGIYINNDGLIYLLNATAGGNLNVIQYDLATKNFNLLELPGENFQKDDFGVHFLNNDEVYVGNSELAQGKLIGVTFTKFDFKADTIEKSVFYPLSAEFKSKIVEQRKANKQIKGDEDWLDYDLTNFVVEPNENILFALEKRSLYADGYPHVSRDFFDKSHQVEFNGHVYAEGIVLLYFKNDNSLAWNNYIPKSQVYPADDGLNTISFVINNDQSVVNLLYVSSESLDGSFTTINLVNIDKASGQKSAPLTLPNSDKISLVKDFTIFRDDHSLIVVGKKGLLGKSSLICKYNY